MRKALAFIKSNLSLFSIASILLFLISLPVYFIARANASFADLLNSTVSHLLRALLGTANRLFPFSLFEVMVIFALPVLALVIYLGLWLGRQAGGRVRFIAAILAVISLICTSYIYTLGVGYHTSPLSARLSLENKTDISKSELVSTYLTVLDEVNRYSELVSYEGQSIMPYSFADLSDKLSHSYSQFSEEHEFLRTYTTRAKPVLFSSVMSDAGILGIYSFFTGEPNVNTEYPDYKIPFTAAHEFAHARGISRENEANFMAFLVCISSSDAYIRYSGYLCMYEYLASALYSSDKETYLSLKSALCEGARADLLATSAVSAKHRDSVIGKINERLNDFYLKSNGTEGTVSYGYVVRLAVAYYNK